MKMNNVMLIDQGYEIELTIGIPTYKDYHGLYFTLQALRMYQDCDKVEFIIVDNYGCDATQTLVESWTEGKYIRNTDGQGTAFAKELIFEHAKGNAVLCMDCHVLLAPDSIKRLKQYYKDNPDTTDLLQGPLLYDDVKTQYTHFDPVWSGEMYGTWASDIRGKGDEPFEIPMQGMGVFSCRKNAWLGFNPNFKGFGGEEGYIHEKFRQNKSKCLCLPWLKWLHRFERPDGIPYPVTIDDKIRNYIVGWSELGLDLSELVQHFSDKVTLKKMIDLISEGTGGKMNITIEEEGEEN